MCVRWCVHVRGPTRRSCCLLCESGAPSHDGARREQGGWGGRVSKRCSSSSGSSSTGHRPVKEERQTLMKAPQQQQQSSGGLLQQQQQDAIRPKRQRQLPEISADIPSAALTTRSLSSCLVGRPDTQAPPPSTTPPLPPLRLYPLPFSFQLCSLVPFLQVQPHESCLLRPPPLSPPPLSLFLFHPSVSRCLSFLWLPNQPVNAQCALCDWYERVCVCGWLFVVECV